MRKATTNAPDQDRSTSSTAPTLEVESKRQPRPQMACVLCAMGPACFLSRADETHGNAIPIVAAVHQIEKGKTLCAAGASQQALFAIRAGAFKACARLPGRQSHIVEFPMRGDVIGLESLGGEESAADVVALTRSTVCEIPIQRINALCAQSSAVAVHLRALMSASIRRYQCWLAALADLSAMQKIAMFLIDLAKRGGRDEQLQTGLVLHMKRNDVANYLGLSYETVSRSFSALRASGIVSANARVLRILNLPALKQLMQVTPRHGSTAV